jgi:hypothetical protein
MKKFSLITKYQGEETDVTFLRQLLRKFMDFHPDFKQIKANFSNSSRDFPQEWRYLSPMLER